MSSQPPTTPNWKDPQFILHTVLLLMIFVVTLFGYTVTKPAATVSTQSVVNNPLEASTLLCKESSLACVKAENGAPISAYSDAGTTKTFNVDSSTGNVSASGNISVTGVITTNGGYIGITPVATATAMPTSTPAPTATPQTNFLGATAGQHVYCSSQNVIGVATVNPTSIAAAGITTPQAVIPAFGGAHASNPDNISETHAGGGVSLYTWQQIVGATTTPVAATTVVAVDYCIVGNP
jgi:hypothetical protein